MNLGTLDATGTRSFTGATLYRTFFHPWSFLAYALLAAPLFPIAVGGIGNFVRLIVAIIRGDEDVIGFLNVFLDGADPIILYIAFLSFMLFVIHDFIDQKFRSDEAPTPQGEDPLHFLSFDVLLRLREPWDVRVRDLVQASLDSPCGAFILREMNLDPRLGSQRIQEAVESEGHTDTAAFLGEARAALPELARNWISPSVVIRTIFRRSRSLQALLDKADISLEDLDRILQWEWFHHHVYGKRDSAWSPHGLLRIFGGMGRSFVMGYVHALERLTVDISDGILYRASRKTIIHQDALKNVLHVLSRSKQHNILMIGKPGTGKKTLIENMTYTLRSAERDQGMAYTRVLVLRIEQLLSGVGRPDTFLLDALQHAQKAGRFILVIRDLGLLLKGADEHVKAVILRFLEAPNINVIGIVDPRDYHTCVKKNPALDQLFERIILSDASDEETVTVLMEHYFQLEDRQHVSVSYRAMSAVLDYSKRYLGRGGLPGKATEILEDAVLLARQRGEKSVSDADIREVVSLKAHMDISGVGEDERTKLLTLEQALRETIVDQDEAVSSLVHALKRARLDIGSGKKPAGTFLFLGPTGVGKTYTAKTIAEKYFCSTESFIRLDMNEFSTEASIAGIIGSPELGEGFLAQRVQDWPFSLILLDEIEKAHPKVLNLFLQILDEGFLTDEIGLRTDFRNTIIIATSNAGALFIREFVKAHPDWAQGAGRGPFKEALIDNILKQGLFSPEFLNRFDGVIVFYPLTEEGAVRVATLLFADVARDFQEKRGVVLHPEDGVLRAIVEKGYSLEFGAREMRRAVVDLIENYLADYLLKNPVRRGEEIVIKKEDLKM